MQPFDEEMVQTAMDGTEQIRVVCLLGSSVHGKTTLANALSAHGSLEPTERAKAFPEVADGASRVQARTLMLEGLTYLLDTPGHADFAAHAVAALRLADGALVVLDASAGLLSHGKALLRLALAERVRPVLFVNGLDKCTSAKGAESLLRAAVAALNEAVETCMDELLGDARLRPEFGDVAFGSALQGWAVTLPLAAERCASKLGVPPKDAALRLWKEPGLLATHVLEPLLQPPQGERGLDDADAFAAEREWANLASTVSQLIHCCLPSPEAAQSYRAEHLYNGPPDDAAARGLRACSPTAPLLAFVSCLLPAADGAIYGLGRVFSGTLDLRRPVMVHCDAQHHGARSNARAVLNIESLWLPLGGAAEPVQRAVAGNLVLVAGPEQFLLKAGSLTEEAAQLAPLRFGPALLPWARTCVKPLQPEALPQLAEALRWLAKVEPAVQCGAEEWGAHVVAGCGQRHLDACVAMLRSRLAPVELEVLPPAGAQSRYGTAYRETVHEASSEVAVSLEHFEASAAPLGECLSADMDAGMLEPPLGDKQRASVLVERYKWEPPVCLWSFGPGDGCGANAFSDTSTELGAADDDRFCCRSSVAAACRWAAAEGGLCEEPLRSVHFSLSCSNSARRSGQMPLVGLARRCLLASELRAAAGLLEPWCWAEVLCEAAGEVPLRETLLQLGAEGLDGQSAEGRLRLQAELPAVAALGLNAALESVLGVGRFDLEAAFSRWVPLQGNLSSEGRHREAVLDLRRWKQLRVAVPEAENFLGKWVAAVLDDDLADVVPQFRAETLEAGADTF